MSTAQHWFFTMQSINYITHIDVCPGRNFGQHFLLTDVANKSWYHEYQKGDGPGTTQHPGSLHLWTVLGPRSMGISPLYVWSPTLQQMLWRGPSGLAPIQERCSVNIGAKSSSSPLLSAIEPNERISSLRVSIMMTGFALDRSLGFIDIRLAALFQTLYENRFCFLFKASYENAFCFSFYYFFKFFILE